MKKIILFVFVMCMIVACVACTGEQGLPGIQGERGAQGVRGEKGETGEAGVTPTVEISKDGYWVINGVKTNVKAESTPEYVENPQGLDFYLKNDGTYAVEIGEARYLSNIVIPNTYNGKLVTEVAGFSNAKKLISVTLPENLRRIGDEAFKGCTLLTEITIPDTVTVIGTSAFMGCTGLTEVTIPENVTTVGAYAFYGCTGLTDVTVGSAVILDYAFYDCTQLSEVTLSSALTTVGNYVFYNCASLTEITVPENVTEIGAFAFRRSGITSVNFEKNYGWCHGDDAFTAVELDNYGSDYLTIGYYKNVWTRDVDAQPEAADPNFVCGGISNTEVRWAITKIGGSDTAMKLTVVGNGEIPDYRTAGAPWSAYVNELVEIEIGEGITAIGRCAFSGLKFVRDVALPEGLETIGEYAFSDCYLIKYIAIPTSVTTVDATAFVKTGVAEIVNADYAYVGTLNADIKWTLTWADADKTKVKLSVVGVGDIPDYTTAGAPWYGYLENIVEIEVGEGITAIGRCAFYGLKFVRSVTLHEGLEYIGEYAFNTCRLLKEIDIPASVTAIDATAFQKTGIPAGEIPTITPVVPNVPGSGDSEDAENAGGNNNNTDSEDAENAGGNNNNTDSEDADSEDRA